jgi:hypothetical protein
MSTAARVRRGRASERALAAFLRRQGWPFAEPCPAFAPGPDVTGLAGLSVEVKSRTRLDPLAAMREAESRPGLPIVVVRLNGQGDGDPGEWLALVRVHELVPLLRAAGYGDALPDAVAADV